MTAPLTDAELAAMLDLDFEAMSGAEAANFCIYKAHRLCADLRAARAALRECMARALLPAKDEGEKP